MVVFLGDQVAKLVALLILRFKIHIDGLLELNPAMVLAFRVASYLHY